MIPTLKMKNIHVWLLFFSFQIILCSLNNETGGAVGNPLDRKALLKFKSLLSDPGNTLSGWNSSSSHCSWLGVTCRNDNHRVNRVHLPRLGLAGTISPHLSNLTSLESLDLSHNSLFGLIPTEFSRFSRLTNITLASNYINGTIPTALSQCRNLQVISLESNKLTGDLPSQLGHLESLKVLDVAMNNLTGQIPPSYGNLSSLTILSLARNRLSGNILDQLGRLQNLRVLQLSENQFSGHIPASIFNISSLSFLSLTNNNLSGEIPAHIGPNLEQLYLGNNSLVGLIPPTLSNATKIRMLDLSLNYLRGAIPPLANMQYLQRLHLSVNFLSSSTELNSRLFQSLTNCTQLQFVAIDYNNLTGDLPSSIGNLSIHLRELCIGNNYLTGSFPRGLERYKNLTALALNGNFFMGEIPNSIGMLPQLQRFLVQKNMLSGEIPDIFSNLTLLNILMMGQNQFSGVIPASIGKCQHLNRLSLGWNQLHGVMPTQIFWLSGLSYLNLTSNALTGSLPAEVGKLTQIEAMDISNNSLSGKIPITIGACLSLRDLSLARNHFNGSIPPQSLGKLVALESLDLSYNKLSGPIPQDLEKFRFLHKLNLSFNKLEGPVPQDGVFNNTSYDSLQGNENLCGGDRVFAQRLRLATCVSKKKSNIHLLLIKIFIPVICFIVLVSIIYLVSMFLCYKRKKKNKQSSPSRSVKGLPEMVSYSEIWRATNGFAEENLVGKGGFGSVYKASFGPGEDGFYTTMAIKVIDLQVSKASKSFSAECEALRNIRHRNLVKVFTSCSSIDHKGNEFKALIMDYMPSGNLDQWLYPQDNQYEMTLTITQRLNMAIDVASSIDYLHHDCNPPVVHCDLKPGNVLLDENMVAHVGDFGLARFLSSNPSQNESSTIGLKGSIGYMAPEYGLGSNASTKGDVYSFGILVLEMFSAKKPTDEMFQEGLNLIKFASEVEISGVWGIVDSRLLKNNEYSEHITWTASSFTPDSSNFSNNNSDNNWHFRTEGCLVSVIKVALSCTTHLPKDRLTMREALAKLYEIKHVLLN